MEVCGKCKWRAYREDGGCRYSLSETEPMLPSTSSKCVFLKEKHGGVSKFEADPKYEQHGKLVAGYEVDAAPYKEFQISEPPILTGEFSFVAREEFGTFAVDADGNLYNPETFEPTGKNISEWDEKVFTKEEGKRLLAEGKRLMLEHIT